MNKKSILPPLSPAASVRENVAAAFVRSPRRLVLSLFGALALLPNLAHADHYNRQAAASYALTYAKNYNGYYPRFENDCTNFASQCLRQGGWANRGSNYYDLSNWFFTKNWAGWTQWSYTWTVANGLEQFLPRSNRAYRCSFYDLQPGDIVACDWNGGHPDGTADHMMVVTGVGWNVDFGWTVYVSYHSNDQRNVPLNAIIGRYSDKSCFRFWHLRDDY